MPIADLSQPVESGMPVYPGDPAVSVDAHATMAADGYRVSALSCGSHTGTHVDAPSHTEPDGRAIDGFPVSRFVRDAVRVDLRHLSAREAIRPADLPTVDAEAVVLWTGWGRYWGDADYLAHPYLTPAAARHCAEQGYDVAVDALNVDPTPAPGPGATDGAGGSGDPHATDGAGGSGDPHATDGAGGSGDPHATDDHAVGGAGPPRTARERPARRREPDEPRRRSRAVRTRRRPARARRRRRRPGASRRTLGLTAAVGGPLAGSRPRR
nr:cyclase family protein [Halomicroarcula sp. SHR3]